VGGILRGFPGAAARSWHRHDRSQPYWWGGDQLEGTGAGVWVIAEATTLPTRFRKIVVTDDRGRYVVPDLPRGTYSGDILQVRTARSTPLSTSSEHEGWIKGEWRANEHNRRAKFYALTRPGQKHLDKEAANWERISSAITRVLTLKEA
jgi:hypothetical protein